MLESKFGTLKGKEDPYGVYIGKYVEIIAQNTNYCGRYQGISESEDIILNPHIRREFHITNKDEKREPIFTIIEEPLFINRHVMQSLTSVREEYIMSLVKGKEIILPHMA